MCKNMAMPEDIKKNIIALSKRLKKEPKELAAEMKTIIKEDVNAQTIENPEHKIRYAWGILFGRYARGALTDVYFRPFLSPRVRELKDNKTVTDVYGFVCPIEETEDGKESIGDPELAGGTLWDKSAIEVGKLESGKLYRTAMTLSETKGGYKISGDNLTFKEANEKIPTINEFYEKYLKESEDEKLIGLGEMDFNFKTFDLDYRIFKATIQDARKGTGNDGRDYGVYNISDTTLISDSDKPIALSVWLDPEDVIFGIGSVINYVATLEPNKKKPGEVIMNSIGVFPTDASFKMEVRVIGQKESVNPDELDDLDDADDKPQEKKAVAEEIEDDFGV